MNTTNNNSKNDTFIQNKKRKISEIINENDTNDINYSNEIKQQYLIVYKKLLK